MHYLIIATYAVITCFTAFSMEIEPQEAFKIKHSDGDIVIPNDVVQKYSVLRTATTTGMKRDLTLNEYDHKHVCTFFDTIQNKLTTPLDHRDLKSLLALNDYVSGGNTEEQLLFQKQITSPLSTFLKTNPKKLYQHIDKLCLYENIFDTVDNSTKKKLATLADNPEEETSFCCALYMAMYNSRLSKLWYTVTQATPINIRPRYRATIAEADAQDPFLLALKKWKKEDPARRLFGKLMDALGHYSIKRETTDPTFNYKNGYEHSAEINSFFTSLHNLDSSYHYTHAQVSKLFLDNAFDRCHLPLIAEYCEYVQERAYDRRCARGMTYQINRMSFGNNKSIRRFYDVDSIALNNAVFQSAYHYEDLHVNCSIKQNAQLDGLDTISPSKNICLEIPSLPSSTHYTHQGEGIENKTIYAITPPWWRLKTIATLIGGAGILYAISKSITKAHLANETFYKTRIDNEFFNVITDENMQAFRAIKSVRGESYVKIMDNDLVKDRLNNILYTWHNTAKNTLTDDSLTQADTLLKTANTIDVSYFGSWFVSIILQRIVPAFVAGFGFLNFQGRRFLSNTIGLVFPGCAERTCTICVPKQSKNT
jgi:hypothetical protein